MGLPQIDINFNTLAVSAIKRSQRGIVALILRDDTNLIESYEYKVITDIKAEDWTPESLKLIKQVFLGAPSKVIVIRGKVADVSYADQLVKLKYKTFKWLAVPGIVALDTVEVWTWVKAMRLGNKPIKAVLPDSVVDHEGIVNFTTSGIKVGVETYSASQYTARIVGILAGLGLDRSATYYELSEVKSITESETPDADIENGELILINQDGKIKIGRAVNSLTTTTVQKSDIFKKIKTVEGMDLIKTDIKTTFNNEYIGKVNNSYDNQVLFITSVRAYLKGLEGTVLDPAFKNTVGVNVEGQRLAWEGTGADTAEWDDQTVKERTFQSNVYLDGNLKLLDAMEDLKLDILLI